MKVLIAALLRLRNLAVPAAGFLLGGLSLLAVGWRLALFCLGASAVGYVASVAASLNDPEFVEWAGKPALDASIGAEARRRVAAAMGDSLPPPDPVEALESALEELAGLLPSSRYEVLREGVLRWRKLWDERSSLRETVSDAAARGADVAREREKLERLLEELGERAAAAERLCLELKVAVQREGEFGPESAGKLGELLSLLDAPVGNSLEGGGTGGALPFP